MVDRWVINKGFPRETTKSFFSDRVSVIMAIYSVSPFFAVVFQAKKLGWNSPNKFNFS